MKRRDSGMHLCAILLARWPELRWRRHGLGALQAYLVEGGELETRVHVWHPELVRPGIRDHGDLHDHRFSFVSTVLVGVITNRLAILTDSPTGEYEVHQVLHARANPEGSFAAEPMRVVPGPLDPRARFVDVDFRDVPYWAGDTYTFERGRFHGTVADCLAVTVVTKFDQVDAGARILARRGSPPVPAFDPADADDPALGGTMLAVLAEAKAALSP